MSDLVLVTGAAGFAGSHLVDLLSAEGIPVIAWHRPNGMRPRVVSGTTNEAIDLLDRAAVRAALARTRPVAVYHCAGASHVARSFQSTEPTFAVNVRGTHHLIEGLREEGIQARVLITSSAMVYATSEHPLREEDPILPTSPYALSKLAQEMVGAGNPDGPDVLIARAFNHFGPRQDPWFVGSGFARRIADIEVGRWEPEIAVGNLDARRDLTDVRDTVKAYRQMVERGTPGRIYNVCSGHAMAIRELLDELLSRARVPIRIKVDPARYRPNDQPVIVGDASRISAELGWKPEIPLEKTFDDLLDVLAELLSSLEAYSKRRPIDAANCSLTRSQKPAILNGEQMTKVCATYPLLFDLERGKPTTRQIADAVKMGGTAALTQAERRADEARYQEVTCRSALNRVQGMPFAWTLNPYRGCTHGCHYCFARRYHVQFEMNADDEFASVILVKRNFVEVLRKELDRPSWVREHVAFGTATDPYQPIEGHYKLTRGAIEALARAKTPIGLITKGPMVVRDRDVLLDLTRTAHCTVYMSVPTVDEDAWRTLEPGTAHPLQRLRAVRDLIDAGVNAGVLMAPIVPGFSSSRSKVERTIKTIAEFGARFVGCNVMYLQDGTRSHFMKFIERDFPSMRPRFEKLYAKKYAPEAYVAEVKAMVRVLQDRYGVARRPEPGTSADREREAREAGEASGTEQVGFAF